MVENPEIEPKPMEVDNFKAVNEAKKYQSIKKIFALVSAYG